MVYADVEKFSVDKIDRQNLFEQKPIIIFGVIENKLMNRAKQSSQREGLAMIITNNNGIDLGVNGGKWCPAKQNSINKTCSFLFIRFNSQNTLNSFQGKQEKRHFISYNFFLSFSIINAINGEQMRLLLQFSNKIEK